MPGKKNYIIGCGPGSGDYLTPLAKLGNELAWLSPFLEEITAD
jgi:hypothetical protein